MDLPTQPTPVSTPQQTSTAPPLTELLQTAEATSEALSLALEQKVEKYGELASECAEDYLRYGVSLLNLARLKSSPLGLATEPPPPIPLPVASSQTSSSSPSSINQVKDPSINQDSQAQSANSSEHNEDNVIENEKEGAKEEEEEEEEETKEEDNKENATGKEEKEGAKEEGVGQGEDPDDMDLLQLSWENLEVARLIIARDKGDSLLLAEIHLLLGELSLENSDLLNAEQEFQHSMKIRQKLLPTDHPLIAESYYRLGVAQSFMQKLQPVSDSTTTTTPSASSSSSAQWLSALEKSLVILDKHLETPTTDNESTSDPAFLKQKEYWLGMKKDIKEKIESELEAQKAAAQVEQPQPSVAPSPVTPVEQKPPSRRITPVVVGPPPDTPQKRKFGESDQNDDFDLKRMKFNESLNKE
eukprot:TRINITY_DN193_c0_g1_i1.p1 TRINITY_DN193_c0_g1~~TRINITY_DN193_c0_g1_i1.p1  ORF type:complete len:415 (-),score=163.57 TRINITY_DN193_c0_g1_i1:79-1323(-)